MRRRALPATLAVVVGLGAGACADEGTAGSAGPATTAPPATAAATTAGSASTDPATSAAGPSAAPTVVPEVLQFSAPLVGGGTFDATSVAGTPLALWFWAPG